MGTICRLEGSRDWNDDVWCFGAAERTPAEVRIRAGARHRNCKRTPGSRVNRMKKLCCGIFGLLATVGIAGAQSTAELEQQLQDLKQQYADTTRAMEQRIA